MRMQACSLFPGRAVAITPALDKDVRPNPKGDTIGRKKTDVRMKFPRFLLLLCVFMTLVFGGCGDDKVDKEATITLVSVKPLVGYIGVDSRFEFTIQPGQNTNEAGMTWQVDFGDGIQVSGEGAAGTAAHTFERAGEYEVILKAVFDGDEVGRATTNYRVLSPVDIEADNVRGAPANVRTGEDITISMVVRNNTASDVIAPFDVGIYLSTTSNVTEEDLVGLNFIGTIEVAGEGPDAPSIPTGEDRNIGMTAQVPANVASGDYFLVAMVDPDNQVGDTNRNNNLTISAGILRVDNTAEAIPDVTIVNVVVIPDRAFPALNTITRGFTIQNLSNIDAFDVVHRTYLSVGNDVLDTDDALIAESEAFDVPARSTVEVNPAAIVLDDEIQPPEMQEISVYVIVVVEVTDGTEVNTDNNTTSFEILVTDQPVEGPDLAVKMFNVSPDRTFLNGTLEIQATLANEGTVDVGSFFCGIYLGANARVNTQADPRLDNLNIPALASNETVETERLVIVPGLYDPGTYYIYIVCDPQNALQEPFRSNNSYVFLTPVVVTDEVDVDIYAESITSAAAVTDGDTFDVTINVCVQGSNPSGATKGNLWLAPGLSVNYTAPPTLSFDVPNVLPGECEEVVVQVNAECLDFVDRYTLGVEMDATKVLPENDETNNRKTAATPTTIAGEFCACIEDAFEPNNRSIDAKTLPTGPTSAAICAAGTCDFFAVDVAPADSLLIRNTFNASKGRLTTTLFEPSGVQAIDSDSQNDSQEVATFLVASGGRYIFSVCGTGGSRNLYDLDVQVVPQAPGVDVVARDLTIPSSTTYSVGATLGVGLRVYNVGQSTTTPFEASVVVTANNIVGDADDVPIASQQVQSLAGGAFRDITIESSLPTSLADGDYYLAARLDPAGQLGESNVTNNVAVSRKITIITQCFDPLEPNDSFAGARDLVAGSYNNLIACTTAPDVYRVCLDDGKKFTATAQFDPTTDIDLELFNDQFQLIDSSATSAGVEQVSVDYVNGSQCYYVRTLVIALPNQTVEGSYSFDLEVQDVDPALLCSSAFEPNDAFTTAASLLAATGQAFTLDRCPAPDTDYYYVDLVASQNVTFSATLTPASQQGTLRLQVYLPSHNPGPNIETAPGVPSANLNYFVPQSGRYYLQVTVSGSQRNVTYDLDVTGLVGVDLQPQAGSIGPGSYAVNDQIRFGFELANLGTTSVNSPPYSVYFGDNATPNAVQDVPLGSFTAPNVAGNSSVAVADRVNVPANATVGPRYIHIIVDENGLTGDVNPANNTISIPITIAP